MLSQFDDTILANTYARSSRHPSVDLCVPSAAEPTESPKSQVGSALLLCKDLFAKSEARLTNRAPRSARNLGFGVKVVSAAECAEMTGFGYLHQSVHLYWA